MELHTLLAEVRRRKVGRVAVGYTVVGWALIEGADTIFPLLRLPSWSVTLVVVAVLTGFPLAVTLSWLFDVVPDAAGGAGSRRLRSPLVALPLVLVMASVAGLSLRLAPRLLWPDGGTRTVLVLPFTNLSADPEQEYFAIGMYDALISELGQVSAVNVISRTSAMRYGSSGMPLDRIAREIGVDAVVEGSVERAGDEVRVRVNLIEPLPRERRVWGREYRRRVPEVLAMHAEIARGLAQAIQVPLTQDQATRLTAASPVDPATYEAYLRGMFHLNRAAKGDVEAGLAHLHRAVELNPADPLAYAGLALGYATVGHSMASTPDAWHRAGEAARRALRLDPHLAEAHAAMADVKLYHERDWEGARAHFLRANELNPSLAMNHYHFAWYLALFDRLDEAVEEHERARALDPLMPLHTAWLGALYLRQGRYKDAIAAAGDALKLRPDSPPALIVLGNAHLRSGRVDEALAVHGRLAAVAPEMRWLLGRTCAAAGRTACARRIAAELEAEPITPGSAYGLAAIHGTLGDRDRALHYLAHEPQHAWVPWVRNAAWARGLHGDPRFRALMARMNLPAPERGDP